jgi:hypothetical protein
VPIGRVLDLRCRINPNFRLAFVYLDSPYDFDTLASMSTSMVDFETADAGGLGKRRCTAIRQSAYKQRNLIVVPALQEINPAVEWNGDGEGYLSDRSA